MLFFSSRSLLFSFAPIVSSPSSFQNKSSITAEIHVEDFATCSLLSFYLRLSDYSTVPVTDVSTPVSAWNAVQMLSAPVVISPYQTASCHHPPSTSLSICIASLCAALRGRSSKSSQRRLIFPDWLFVPQKDFLLPAFQCRLEDEKVEPGQNVGRTAISRV